MEKDQENKPFSCSASSCCRAVAASMRTGTSGSLDRMLRMTSSAVLRLFTFLNFTSAKLLTTQHAYNNTNMHSAQHVSSKISPFLQTYIIRAMMIVWRVTWKFLCSIVCNSCAQCNGHTYEQT